MSDKTSKDKKPNLFQRMGNGIRHWWRETIGELRKVSWPTVSDAWRLTKIVLAVMVSVGLCLWLFDLGFSRLIALIYS
jgi:preprotein translocase subunit SecE